ncbi:5-methylcytosine-specific restriction enzyme subunit McrC [Curtobacterium sp. 320]|uniref:McrC family protein n=1 Tax=Curtobacterium sp. 320 TaxID=2817749 RepID=UPI0028649E91|nr:restriction endonuclease [Curtobacterium sp. 320]MDR6572472.1 5-methylcytosine-specific restriction enzyme subunit McrC [Curtobacterium sp. 320]
MPREVAAGLVAARIADVSPTFVDDEYRVSGVRKVGVVRIAGHDVWIRPKTPVRRLFAMLGYARAGSAIWEDEDFGFAADEDLVPALAHAFERQASRALAGGALRGYVTRDDALPLVRGRWRIGDQLTRRGGQPLPVEVSFDDYVGDIEENQLVLSAATRLLRLPGVPADVVGRLRRVVRVLDGVTLIPVGAPVPVVRSDRRNVRYSAVLPLASLVLSGASVEQRAGSLVGAGFLVDMWSVFEDFVTAALREAFRPYGGELVAQYSSTLDVEGAVKIAPDLVWLVDGEVRACIDVKYKVEKHGQYPNADLYQMAAYCRRFGLDAGHLVYAEGQEPEGGAQILNGPSIRRHALRIDAAPHVLSEQIGDLSQLIARPLRVLA